MGPPSDPDEFRSQLVVKRQVHVAWITRASGGRPGTLATARHGELRCTSEPKTRDRLPASAVSDTRKTRLPGRWRSWLSREYQRLAAEPG
jgi:hypothetical protein